MHKAKRLFYHVEQFSRMIWATFLNFPAFIRYHRTTLDQMNHLGYASIFLVMSASIMIGMVLALEWGKKLELFGAKLLMGRIISIAVIRETGPLITGLMLSGRIGASIAAELGSMKQSEQLDAMRAMGADPVPRLIVPRIAATMITFVPLVAIADAVAIIGGWIAAVVWLQTDSTHFWISALDGLFFKDLTIGLIKPFFMGFTIASISCYYGISTYGGAEGVGRSATRAVMACSLAILFMDFLISKLILAFYA
ncbi:MAG: ABC transporter permease [Calditrichaeota bacterium]|nr:MAG: ABC transporter permease [Calditrichota bacterium]